MTIRLPRNNDPRQNIRIPSPDPLPDSPQSKIPSDSLQRFPTVKVPNVHAQEPMNPFKSVETPVVVPRVEKRAVTFVETPVFTHVETPITKNIKIAYPLNENKLNPITIQGNSEGFSPFATAKQSCKPSTHSRQPTQSSKASQNPHSPNKKKAEIYAPATTTSAVKSDDESNIAM